MKMCKASILHMPSGYAAVGEVAKPPFGKLPIICWPWNLWPQCLGLATD